MKFKWLRITNRDLRDLSRYLEEESLPLDVCISHTRQYINQVLQQLPIHKIPDNWDDVLSIRWNAPREIPALEDMDVMISITPFSFAQEVFLDKKKYLAQKDYNYRILEHDAGIVFERFQREVAGYVRVDPSSCLKVIDRILFRIHFFHTDVGQELLGVHCVREVDALWELMHMLNDISVLNTQEKGDVMIHLMRIQQEISSLY